MYKLGLGEPKQRSNYQQDAWAGYGPRITPRKTLKITYKKNRELEEQLYKNITFVLCLWRHVNHASLVCSAQQKSQKLCPWVERITSHGNDSNMKLVLMERGLWGCVEGTETALNITTTYTVHRNAYHLPSDKTYSLIIALRVDMSLQVYISSMTDPHAAWEVLQKQFECVLIAQIIRLNCKFYAATMKERSDLMEQLRWPGNCAN